MILWTAFAATSAAVVWSLFAVRRAAFRHRMDLLVLYLALTAVYVVISAQVAYAALDLPTPAAVELVSIPVAALMAGVLLYETAQAVARARQERFERYRMEADR